MAVCHCLTGSCVAMSVEPRSARSSMNFHKVASVRVLERMKEPVIDGEQVEFGEPAHNPRVGAVTPCDGKVRERDEMRGRSSR